VSLSPDRIQGRPIDNLQAAEKMKNHMPFDGTVEVDGRVAFEHETIDSNTQ